jgi:hypothetical protein
MAAGDEKAAEAHQAPMNRLMYTVYGGKKIKWIMLSSKSYLYFSPSQTQHNRGCAQVDIRSRCDLSSLTMGRGQIGA